MKAKFVCILSDYFLELDEQSKNIFYWINDEEMLVANFHQLEGEPLDIKKQLHEMIDVFFEQK